MLNSVCIQGRLVAQPELKTTQGGTEVTSFTVACERSYAKQGEERQTDFIEVVCWGKTAGLVCKWFGKGQMIIISGSLQTRNYEDKSGNKRKAVEVRAESVNFAGDRKQEAKQKQETVKPKEEAFVEIDDSEDLPF